MLAAALIWIMAEGVAQPVLAPPPVPGRAFGPVPMENPGNWIHADDYPASALRNGEAGTTGFALSVDALGRVSACAITSSSGSSTLDIATCTVLQQRAKFRPANNAAGQAVASTYHSRTRWTLPAPPVLPAAMELTTSFIVETDGTRSHCVVKGSGPMPVDRAPLAEKLCQGQPFTEPYRNAQGQPIRQRVTRTVSTTVEDVAE